MAYALAGVALGVAGVLFYVGIIDPPLGYESRILTSAVPKRTSSSKKTTKVWDAVAVDQNGTPTAYALVELSGRQLDKLMRKGGFVWARGIGWLDGTTTVTAVDAQGTPLEKKSVNALKAGCEGTSSYYVETTSAYTEVASAYEALVADSLEASDLVAAPGGYVCVAYGPTMRDFLVYLVQNEADGVTMRVFGEEAVEAGAFDLTADGSYGTTPAEVYEALATAAS